MNTLNKVLKSHSEIYDPHKQMFQSLRENKYLYIAFVLIMIEVFAAQYFIESDNYLIGMSLFFLFFMTVILSTFFHLKLMQKKYGSIENFDLVKRDNFIKLLLSKLSIDITDMNHNLLINEFIQEKLSRLNKKEEAKHSFYLGLLTIIIPLSFPFFFNNAQNVFLMSILIMSIGIIIAFLSVRSFLKEYRRISKLEHISEILKEIRLAQLIKNDISISLKSS